MRLFHGPMRQKKDIRPSIKTQSSREKTNKTSGIGRRRCLLQVDHVLAFSHPSARLFQACGPAQFSVSENIESNRSAKRLRGAPHSDRLVPDCPSLSSSVLVGSSPNLHNWRARASLQACKVRNRNSIGQGRLPGAEVAAVSVDHRHPSVASLSSSGTLREELLTKRVS